MTQLTAQPLVKTTVVLADTIQDILVTTTTFRGFAVASIFVHFELVGYASYLPIASTKQYEALGRPGVVLCPEIEGDAHYTATISDYCWEGVVMRDGKEVPLLLCKELGNLVDQVWGVLRSDRADINCPF
jgi:hypothetical protein